MAALFLCAPCSKARAIDPYSASFAAASAIASAIDSADRIRWQQKTSAQLDEIIDNQKLIILDLQNLRLDIKQLVSEQFTRFVEANLKADITELDLNTNAVPDFALLDEGKKSQILANESKLENDVQVVESYGPATYQEAFAGDLALAALYKFTGDDQRRQGFLQRQKTVFSEWLTQQPGYPATIKARSAAALASDQAVLVSYQTRKSPTTFVNGFYVPGLINGDLINGFQLTFRCPIPHCGSAPFKAQSAYAELQNAHADYVNNTTVLNRMVVILSQIEKYRDALSSWSASRMGQSGL